MIVRLQVSAWSYDQLEENIKTFFESNGATKDAYGDKKECELIAHVDEIPTEVLNSRHVDKSFHKGLKAMTDNFISGANYDHLKGKEVTHIHLPSLELFSVKQVDWREECCTEELQKLLNDGWRIIAVIPRVGFRRPDYIIGR